MTERGYPPARAGFFFLYLAVAAEEAVTLDGERAEGGILAPTAADGAGIEDGERLFERNAAEHRAGGEIFLHGIMRVSEE